MKLLFAGTPEIAATVLQGLLQSEHEVLAVLTQPDRPSGRGQKLIASSVKVLALEAGIPVHQPLKLRDPEIQDLLKSYQADLMIVVAYGLIVPEAVLAIPKLGCWNVHVSLLPRWRGAAPIQRAIEAGDTQTGVTLMQMDKGLDTGPILLQEKVAISAQMTAGALHDLLAEKGVEILLKGLSLQEQGHLAAKPQEDIGVTYAGKLDKLEARIHWNQKASEIACKIRAFNPWPVAYGVYQDQNIRIWKARPAKDSKPAKPGVIQYINAEGIGVQTGEGVLEILELQMPAGKILSVPVFLNGHHDFFKVGDLLI